MSTSWQDDPRFKDGMNLGSFRVWIFIALTFAVSYFLIRQYSGRPTFGGRADLSWKVTDLDGKPVNLAATYAKKAVFLNVWATWCPPCRAEMPSIDKLAENPRLKDVAFLCISVDDTASEVKQWVSERKPPMTMLHASEAPPAVFQTDGIPATFLIGRDGRIVRSEVGGRDWDTSDIVTLLERMSKDR